MPTLSLGLGGSNHDFSACVVEGGEIAVAIEEERLTRKKYSVGVNSLLNTSWRYCLDELSARVSDVEHVVADDTLLPPAYFAMRNRVHLIGHHQAHAASAFLPSPFQESAIIVVDGAGSLREPHGVETLTTYMGQGSEMTELSKVWGTNYSVDGLRKARVYQAGDSDNSLGYMYKAISREIGFTLYEEGNWYLTEDGKTMGLAPYGSATLVPAFKEFLELRPGGDFRLHLKDGGLLSVVEGALDGLVGEKRQRAAADLAFAGQALLEDALLHSATSLFDQTGSKNLCLAGGVALNCVANGRLLRETPFENVFVQPAAGDGGCAVGCAFFGYHVLGERPRDRGYSSAQRAQRHAYLGKTYPDQDVKTALKEAGLPFRRVDVAYKRAAERLVAGDLVGWFTGGSEFGPRALGHRSILADPRDPEMKNLINERIKHREDFRPFAPAVLAEHASDFFDLTIESPYMLIVAPVREEKRGLIPSVVHVDNTARVQTLTRSDNGTFRLLVEWFHRLTGVPVVLNTSFNDRGEPIVETPREAMAFFKKSQLDYLFIEGYVMAHSEEALEMIRDGGGSD